MEDKKIYRTKAQLIKLAPIKTAGLILDIGGGGEGVIGKLNGKQVIAIDTNERELRETKNQALKIVMNAANLKFLSQSFSVCTAFFSLMYIPKSRHLKVFKEVYRVLKGKGKFLLWDVKIPEKKGDYDMFAVFLKIQLPSEKVKTGYGTKWNKLQDIKYFKELARKTKFKVINEWSEGEIFYLEMQKASE
jgi:ubiquinone/menaquinone biosynthesis C-methylase UbiE